MVGLGVGYGVGNNEILGESDLTIEGFAVGDVVGGGDVGCFVVGGGDGGRDGFGVVGALEGSLVGS